MIRHIGAGCVNNYFFLSRKGHFFNSSTFNYHWKKILDTINQYMPNEIATDVSPHYFRHNFATELVYAGIPLKTVQYIMGHENIKVTMDIYADVKFDAKDSIEKLEQYWLMNSSMSKVCQKTIGHESDY